MVGIEVILILGENLSQMRGVDNEEPVEDLTAYTADPAFHDRVHARCLRRGAHDPYALGLGTQKLTPGPVPTGGAPGRSRPSSRSPTPSMARSFDPDEPACRRSPDNPTRDFQR